MTLTLGDASDVPRNGRKFYTIDGRSIAVLDVDGTLYAIRNSCPHMGGPVGEGKVFDRQSTSEHPVSRFANFTPDGGDSSKPRPDVAEDPAPIVPTIGCPLHGWEFDLADGTPRFPAKRGLKTYPVWIEDGRIKLDPGIEEPPLPGGARSETLPVGSRPAAS